MHHSNQMLWNKISQPLLNYTSEGKQGQTEINSECDGANWQNL